MEADVSFKDDLRLATVVMRNEFLKHRRGRRILIFGALMVLILGGLTAALFYGGTGDDSEFIASMYLSIVVLTAIIGATLFAATAIVSEYEERTALIIFNRPILKWSIYLGKFLASFLLLSMFMVLYYLVVAAVCLIGAGDVPMELFASLGYCICYVFAIVGVAMMISSFMKKASTASILTFFALFLLFDLVIALIATAAGISDTWYMIGSAAGAITSCLGGPVDAVQAIGTLIAWGVVPGVIGYLKFRNRDF